MKKNVNCLMNHHLLDKLLVVDHFVAIHEPFNRMVSELVDSLLKHNGPGVLVLVEVHDSFLHNV